jgi:purine-binding chemotaxis protein CheW
MPLSSYRQSKARSSEPTQQLIVFRVLQEWFALPIRAAHKVIPIGPVYGNRQGGVGLTRYQDQDVIVIDIQQRIFGEQSQSLLPAATEVSPSLPHKSDAIMQRYLLLLQSPQGEFLGIPLDTFPCLRRVPESAFAPIPPIYLAEGRVRCVSALITAASDEPPAFLLNLSQLVDHPTGLPAAPPPNPTC